MLDMNILLTGVSLVGLVAIGAWVRFFFIRFNRLCQKVDMADDLREHMWDNIDNARKDIKQLQDAIDHINDFLEEATLTAVKNVKPRK